MENENLNQSTSNPVQTPVQPQPQLVPNSPMSQKGFLPLIFGVLILLVIVAGGAYYLGTKQNNNSESSNNTSQQTGTLPTSVVQPTTVTSPTSSPVQNKGSIPSDWTVKNSVVCNVGIPLPPKIAPYYIPEDLNTPEKGGYWQFEEYKAGMFMFETTTRVIFHQPKGSGGYVAGDVEVICSPNTSGHTTQTLMTKLGSYLADGQLAIKTQKLGNMWGRNVNIVQFQGGMSDNENHYIFATPTNIYLVRKVAMSSNQTIQTTTDQILNTLDFSN